MATNSSYKTKSPAPKTAGSKPGPSATPAGKTSCPGGVKTNAGAPPKRVVREQ